MRKSFFLVILLTLAPALLFYGCVGTNPKAVEELRLIRKAADNSRPEIKSSSENPSPNEQAIARELEWIKMAVTKASPELELTSIKKRYLGETEKMVLYKLGPPDDRYLERISQKKVFIYNLERPSKTGFFLKSLVLPRMKVGKTSLQLAIAGGKVVDVQVADVEKEISQGVPGILKLAPTAAMAIKGF